MAVVVPRGGLYLNTDSGLSAPGGILDRLTQAMDARAQNNLQLQGLAAGGLVPQSAAPGPSILSQMLGGAGLGNQQPATPSAPTAAPDAQPAPANGAMPSQAMSYAPPNLTAMVATAAQKYGIDPMTAMKVAMAEGGRSGGYGPAGTGDGGSSFSPFQLHYGGVAGGGNAGAGLGDDFTKATGLDARDPKNAQAAIDFALADASKNGWGKFHGAAKAGVGQWDGITGSQRSGGQLMPQATASGPVPPQAMAFAGSQPPVAPPTAPAAASGAPGAVPASPAGGAGAGLAAPPGPGSRLNGMISLDQIKAMIANPATRQEGIQMFQLYLQPPAMSFGKAGEGVFAGGRYLGQVPSAPMDVAPGNTVVDPNTGRTIAATAPKLEHTETGTDAFGQKQYGAFNPTTGAVAPFASAPGVLPGQDAGANLTGDDFLKTIPPALAGQVKAIAEGRAKMPPAGSRSPMAVKLATMVQQYDPNFDQANAEARFGTRESWAHGDASKTLVAGNTAIQHLGDLSDAAEALNNGRSPTLNKIGQEFGNLTGGNIAGKQFANTLNDFTGELVKFYRGTGGSEHDIEAAKEALDPSQSPAQLHAGIAQQAELISGKVSALQDQWHNSMGPLAKDYPIIQPKSQAALDRIGKRAATVAPAAATAAAAPAAGQRLTPEQAKALPPGTPFTGTDGIARVRH